MKLLKKATFAIVFTAIMCSTFQGTSQTVNSKITFETETPFKLESVHFQEWYAGIKVSATGHNIFLPITEEKENVTIDRVYFRNLTAELDKKDKHYLGVLKNTTKHYTFQKSPRPADYPFILSDNECVISYLENGTRKYYKVKQLTEYAGTYYENGPPSLFLKASRSSMATLDDEEDDN